MNKVILMGRLCRDPEARYSQNGMTVARYTLAVDRPGKDKGADFIPCVAFDKRGEFAAKHFAKGMRVLVSGSIHTDSYKNREGQTIRTTELYLDTQEFADSRQEQAQAAPAASEDDFMTIPDGVDESGLPFN